MPRVFIPAQLRDLTAGVAQIEMDAETVREVVAELELRFPGIQERLCQGDELAPSLQVSIDHHMTGRGLNAKVGPMSEVHFLPVLGGG
jgi:molybdopterin converting factor small subunit